MRAAISACIGLCLSLFLTTSTTPDAFSPVLIDGDYTPISAPPPNTNWSILSDIEDERAHGLENRMVQIRMQDARSGQFWTAGSGTLVLRSNTVLTAAHTFYQIDDTPDARTGQCGCSARLDTEGDNTISDMSGVSVSLFRPDGSSGNTVGITKAFPDNHCRFVRPVRGKCMIPPRYDFTALRLSGFLINGKPLDLRQEPANGFLRTYQFSGFPTALDGNTLVASSCPYRPDRQPSWANATMQTLGGSTCTASRGMSGGPVLDLVRTGDAAPHANLEGVLIAVQRNQVIFRKRDEFVERCVRAAAGYDPFRQVPSSAFTLGYDGEVECPPLQQ